MHIEDRDNVSRHSIDVVCVVLFMLYLGSLLYFSSFFYLATEDYEAIAAVEALREGRLIGKSTGWPYAPLSGFIFYGGAAVFNNSLLGFRLLVGAAVVSSVVPIYLTLRALCEPFLAFSLTVLSFSLSTFPHPRPEYYVEGAFVSYAIFFGVRYLRRRMFFDALACAVFAGLGFVSRGHPNSSILLVLLPVGLVGVPWFLDKKIVWNLAGAEIADKSGRVLTDGWSRLAKMARDGRPGLLLAFIACGCWVLLFLRNAVYKRTLIEYVDVNDLRASIGEILKNIIDWVLLLSFVAVCLVLVRRQKKSTWWPSVSLYRYFSWSGDDSLRPVKLEDEVGREPDPEAVGRDVVVRSESRTRGRLVCSVFVGVGIIFLLIGGMVGYSLDELSFFLIPFDIIVDHASVGRIGGGQDGVALMFVGLLGILGYLYCKDELPRNKAEPAMFLVFLLPATFVRFFPSYNMLYLGVFAVAAFMSCVLPVAGRLWGDARLVSRFKTSVGMFFIVYAVASNYFLLVATQWDDLANGRLKAMNKGSLGGVFIERDIFDFMEVVHNAIPANVRNGPQAILSHRYLKFLPLFDGSRDVFAGQNLTIHLGKLWSYDDVMKIAGDVGAGVLSGGHLVYVWRSAAVEQLEKAGVQVIAMSLYDVRSIGRPRGGTKDPFRTYLAENFVLTEVIEPTMKLYRRSSQPEGAVIFVRKANGGNTGGTERRWSEGRKAEKGGN
ncbi:MAG TPA: hypothetical protein VNN77_09280 [candidate division Zixibacteria bacterium]|nr:hypothetical protein [candidate division Zixibacteria bacterium]